MIDLAPALKITLLNLLLLTANLGLGQENIRFERISVNEGLSQSDVKCLVQDRLGLLWIGTRDGLNRYDGLEFSRFDRKKNDPTAIQFNQILDLQMDQLGDIWIGSIGGISIYNYKRNSFDNFFFEDTDLSDAEVNHIFLTGKHTALLSTNKGLISFDRRKGKFFLDSNLVDFKNATILCTHQSLEFGLWIATNKGIFIKTPGQNNWLHLLNDNSVYDIDIEPNGTAYISASNGLFKYTVKRNLLAKINIPAKLIAEAARMKNGDLWVASNNVIVLDSNDSLKYILSHDKFNEYSLSEDRAKVIFQTADEVIWVGTFGYGLNKFNPNVTNFSYLNERTSIPLSGNYVSTICTTDDTTLLIGTSRGLDVVNLKSKVAQHFSTSSDLFRILKIVSDRNKKVWIATSNGFMLYTDDKLITKEPSLKSVCDFGEWDDSHLILATLNRGIYLFDRRTARTTILIPGKSLQEEVSCLLLEGDHFWVGCKDGLRLYSRKGKLLKYFKADNQSQGSLQASFVKSLYRDSQGKLWIGTWGGGLSVLNADSTFSNYDVSHGLPNNVVYGILEDNAGILWLSTNMGISAFNPRDQRFKNFDFFDGLQSNEFNTGAYFKSGSGEIYFGGVNGLNFFESDKILTQDKTPDVLLTSVTVNNRDIIFEKNDSLRNFPMIKNLRLSWKENDIGIKFTVVDFKHAKKINFQYSIKDTIWYNIGNRRSLELIDLPAGVHSIKVRAKMPDGVWSQPQVLLAIDIIPPVWDRIWFRILVVLGFLFLGFSAYKFRTAQLKRSNATLNNLVNERTKEIQSKNEEIASQNDQLHALNQELQAFSYSVSHDLRAPLRSIIAYSKILEEDFAGKLGDDGKRVLNTVQRNADRMNNLVKDLLEFAKLGRQEPRKSKIDTESLVRNILNEMNIPKRNRMEIKLEVLRPVWADINLLTQVWINLISNAVKYSAKKDNPIVEVGSFVKENDVVFYVKDNGAGFDMNYADKLFGVFQRLHHADEFEGTGVGLALAHRIVTKHDGRIWAEGKVNEGATFYFTLPNLADS
ncbi:MAG TPA: two-component regulator propeller domain-containing protein [Cyclobacteriaceae bacterium]|nr:two-component regulator propeller domain-containing protein [Cyclobacteriaceae bacterium]